MLNSIKSYKINAAVKTITAALFFIIIISILISCKHRGVSREKLYSLVLYDNKTDQEIMRFQDVSKFSIEFIHSVNNRPLKDFYEIRDGKIFVTKTTYYDFGAGVQTELNENEKFYYGENGELVIDNINKEIPNLVYVVGTHSDHLLSVNDGDQISLRDVCGKNTHVRFQVEK